MTLEKWACWASNRSMGDSKVDALLKENKKLKEIALGVEPS